LTVIDEVLTNVREAFLDEGYDEQLLQELKQVISLIEIFNK
jgi:transcription initiation factor TFIIA large subunit